MSSKNIRNESIDKDLLSLNFVFDVFRTWRNFNLNSSYFIQISFEDTENTNSLLPTSSSSKLIFNYEGHVKYY